MVNWLESAFGIGDASEPVAAVPQPREKPEIKSLVCVVRNPGAPGDLGETVDAWYFIEHGTVTLCDAGGQPMTKADGDSYYSAPLAPDANPRTVAYRLRRTAWQSERSPFDRPLYYHHDSGVV
jgi:hypothetical protein